MRRNMMPFSERLKKRYEREGEKFRVLIVSTASTHVGPMVEGLLKKKLPEDLKDRVEISSTGMYASREAPCTIEVIWAGKEFDVDYSKHKARWITKEMMQDADCILTMNKHDDEIMHRTIPSKKPLMLTEFSSDKTLEKIPNPKNENTQFYRNVMKMIDDCTDGFIEYLRDKLLTDKQS